MTTHVINVERREDQGKGASRRLRLAKKIPAIVYGGELAPVSIQLDHEPLWLAQQNEWFYSSILDLSLNGDIQRHPYKQIIMHLDFQRVDENAALSTAVPLHFVNEEASPAGKTAGAVITHELNEVVIECLPKDLPANIVVDLGKLGVGEVLHLSEVALPAGVSIPQLKLGKEHDLPLAIAKAAAAEEEAPAEAADAAKEEPKA